MFLCLCFLVHVKTEIKNLYFHIKQKDILIQNNDLINIHFATYVRDNYSTYKSIDNNINKLEHLEKTLYRKDFSNDIFTIQQIQKEYKETFKDFDYTHKQTFKI